ncbi:MAG: BPSS1780 family membrane protein [Burkholderiales bacterium]
MSENPPPPFQPRQVPAAQALRWLAGGAALFRRARREWILLVVAVFLIMKVTLAIYWILGLIAVLFAPNFMAGLAHGCQALERGQPLRMGYLASGFLKNAGALAIVGALALLGQALTAMLIFAIGGDEMKALAELGPKAFADPANADRVRELTPQIASAFLAGTLVSIPFLLATWFAPMLVFFDNLKPLAAMALSLWACLKNIGAFLLFGAIVIAALVMLMPLGLLTGQLDLGLWLLGPILAPAVYASYRDVFPPGTPAAAAVNNAPPN